VTGLGGLVAVPDQPRAGGIGGAALVLCVMIGTVGGSLIYSAIDPPPAGPQGVQGPAGPQGRPGVDGVGCADGPDAEPVPSPTRTIYLVGAGR